MTAVSPAEGLRAILVAQGIVEGATEWKCVVGRFVAEDRVIAFLDSGGRGSEAAVAMDYPTVQLLARGDRSPTSYSTTYQKVLAAFRVLHKIPQNPTVFPELVSCLARGNVAALGEDDKGRPLLSLNFELIVGPTSVGNRV